MAFVESMWEVESVKNICRACESLECAAPYVGGVGVSVGGGLSTPCRPPTALAGPQGPCVGMFVAWDREGVCPCVAAGAVLESAVFGRASCVLCVRGGPGGAHNGERAGLLRPSPTLKSNVWNCV